MWNSYSLISKEHIWGRGVWCAIKGSGQLEKGAKRNGCGRKRRVQNGIAHHLNALHKGQPDGLVS